MMSYELQDSWNSVLSNIDLHVEAVAARPVTINSTTMVAFDDGTVMDGATLLQCIKTLHHIIAKDYPEELV